MISYKTLLREKDINPMLPWDTVLPLFITDPRYVLLSSVNARRDAFDEYCRDRLREIRSAKVAAEAAPADVSSSSTQLTPKEEFEKLLKEEVKSTRTSWTEWRRTWKNNRRFYGWGRDDREREKRFREWLKELGEGMHFPVVYDLQRISLSRRKEEGGREGGKGLLRSSQRKGPN